MTDLSNATPANTNPMPEAPTSTGVPEAGAEVVQAELTPEQSQEVIPAATETPEVKPDTQLPEVPETEPESTGNEFIDGLLGEFKTNDVDVDKLFGDYLDTGNEESIDFAYLEEKVGKLAAQGLIAGVRAENTKLDQEAEAASKTIYDAAGGEQMWEGILNWIGSGDSGLTKEGGEAYNKMLAAGGVQAELAARELSNMFKQSPGFSQDASLQQADQVAQPTGIQPISRAEYSEQLEQVVRKSGEHSPEAKALHERRLFTMNRGA